MLPQASMTGRLFQTLEMLVPMAVKASVFSSSSMGMEKVLMAKEKAAKRAPTAEPATSMAQPIQVRKRVGRISSRPAKGRSPKNSA